MAKHRDTTDKGRKREVKEYYAVKANDEAVCIAIGKRNAKLVANSLHSTRAFFSKEFEDVAIKVELLEACPPVFLKG